MSLPKISIITPSYNLAPYLEQTILSVLNQSYPNLEYIIIDGGSTDGSVEIIKKYEQNLSYWVSEADYGLYHALQKGFDKSTGKIMGWLNADDMLHPKSLFTIGKIFQTLPEVQWLQGYPTVFSQYGNVVTHRPPRFSKYSFLLKQYHDGKFIQQESTFWTRELWEKSGGYVSQEYKFAGDFELWMRFFQHAQLYNTPAMIGGFRVREGEQLSHQNHNAYMQECDNITNLYLSRLSYDDENILRIAQKAQKLDILPRKHLWLPGFKKLEKALHYTPIVRYDHEKNNFFIKWLHQK